MCKITQYRFSCGHSCKYASSRCGGTKVKQMAYHRSAKAACTAEPYLAINFRFECSNCQQATWDISWKEKLERARRFSDLHGGAAEMLVQELAREYETQAWDIRRLYPHIYRPTIMRVKPKILTPTTRKVSLLRHEVHPNNVTLPKDVEMELNNLEDDDDDDDDDYVRSTDPFHPIDTTSYAHPLDNLDNSWIYEHFSEDELSCPAANDDAGFDAGAGSWDRDELSGLAVNNDAGFDTGAGGWDQDQGLETAHPEKSEETIQAFWEAVNDNSRESCSTVSTTPLAQVDGCTESPAMLPEPPASTFPRAEDSTRAKYNLLRMSIQPLKCIDVKLYCTNWLQIARMEIMAFVGLEGAKIYEPRLAPEWRKDDRTRLLVMRERTP
ncbi:hypothetical protein P280DRAFT_234239 [Massarina eburnea CBS 473.64]|uniref:Uncharacterized protein n=1 Tax=Massarina eburnea CBS 473.64 TaxID=1395130 RepID=A0A6A6RHK6_9PLEO|nr:hypothetical protein P280DRAFT_234239 [Massarina eburnea CBS 473.64]